MEDILDTKNEKEAEHLGKISALEEKISKMSALFKEERDNIEDRVNDMEHRAVHAEENVHHLRDTIDRLNNQLQLSKEKINSLNTDSANLKVRIH